MKLKINNNVKILFLLTLAFVVMITSGYLLNENVKRLTAGTIGYGNYYLPSFARYMFYSDSLNSSLQKIRDDYKNNGDSSQAFRKDKAWIKLIKTDERNFAIIEFSGDLFTFLISLIGLSLWNFRRKKEKIVQWFDWLFLMMSLFFMRETAVIGFDLFRGSKLCNEAKLWRYLGFHWYYIDLVFFILGLASLIFIIVYLVPPKDRIRFLISGLIGFVMSYLILLKFINV
jgi:hypothetical protein